ncbi:MAG: two-component regulator propeller domain-containing protein [Bacteroides graminisolvens]
MAEDEQGNIWISTHQGISKFVTKENRFINYYAGDGIQGNEFTRGAVFKDKRGKYISKFPMVLLLSFLTK